MKEDLRMVAKSPDPDDLANEEPPKLDVREAEGPRGRKAPRVLIDRSAPHIPPLEKGRIRGQ
jgi:hypothetical protein